MTHLAPGLEYRTFRAYDSTVHLLSIDLTQREVRPVMGGESFPLLRTYPIHDAIELGALACVGDGFNVVWFMDLGFADQPSHVTMVDSELWTTGRKGGGVGLQISETWATVAQNHVEMRLWQKGTSVEVENLNFGHDGKVNAFTPRGGTNQVPDPEKHLYEVGEMTIESKWKLPFDDGPIEYKQRIGDDPIHVVSGWPQIITDGVNTVPLLNLDPTASHGPDNWFVRRNPRCALGTSEDGHTVFFCVVEGRIPESKGMRLKQLASTMVREGVFNAVNSDGGGSAYMWLDGQLVADSCYGSGAIEGLRPDHYALSVF